jgi:hypothetical protein
MIFRYWVKFGADGEIEALSKSKIEGSEEYIVKLIPIDRKSEDLKYTTDEFLKSTEKTLGGIKKFRTELEKTAKDLRRLTK